MTDPDEDFAQALDKFTDGDDVESFRDKINRLYGKLDPIQLYWRFRNRLSDGSVIIDDDDSDPSTL